MEPVVEAKTWRDNAAASQRWLAVLYGIYAQERCYCFVPAMISILQYDTHAAIQGW